MGTEFKHVADGALQGCDSGPCHFCGREDRPVYAYFGQVIRPELASDPMLASREPEVDELCAACIESGFVCRRDGYLVKSVIPDYASDPEDAWREFQKLPDLPNFFQGFDWPLCCGQWCEFVRSPDGLEELFTVQEECHFWHHGSGGHERDFRKDGPPESFYEVAVFVCRGCGGKHYTDQFT